MFKKLFSFFNKDTKADNGNMSSNEFDKIFSKSLEEADELKTPLKQGINYENKEERLSLVADYCEQIVTANNSIDDTTAEYAMVTSYIGDVQRIYNLDTKRKKHLRLKVKNIVTAKNEMDNFGKGEKYKINDSQYAMMEKYADVMQEEIRKLDEYEKYRSVVEDDLRKLEGERGVLSYECKSIVRKQELLKIIMTTTLMFVIILTCLFLCIYKTTDADVMTPFFIMVAVVGVVSLVSAIQGTNNKKKAMVNNKKMNRLVELINKTKIKYVNNRNVVDYMYDKFNVKSSMELKYIWGQYISKKDAMEKYENNIKLEDTYSISLVGELRRMGIKDPEIWLHQLDSMVDDKQLKMMEERLMERRNKLMNNIEYNNKLKESRLKEIESIMKMNDVYEQEAKIILDSYGIVAHM